MKCVRSLGFVFWLLVSASTQDSSSTPPRTRTLPPPIAFGYVPKQDEYKWTVGVHRKTTEEEGFEQICGGSLITTKLVLSAAHCFWNKGDDVPIERYIISAGNFIRDFERDVNTQQSEIKQIFFHERYRGNQLNYAHDIVIVLLKEKVTVNNLVAPVAIDWNSSFDDLDLQGQVGLVVGWGFTEYDEPSVTRIAASLPYVDFATCWKTVPQEFRAFITPDKFCAGLRNGTTVCPGDSGGGLVFFSMNDKKWYLRGIVSVGVVPKGMSKCYKSQFSVFTSVSSYNPWLKKKLNSLDLMPDSPSKSSNQDIEATKDMLIFS